jgi:Lipocalin-like domain
MRAHHVVAIVAILVVGFGVKLFFFSGQIAEAKINSSASAHSLSEKVSGVWTLVSGSENYLDGRKNQPWATGNLIMDSGHMSLFLVGKDQPATSPSVRTPVGPFVASYGVYMVDEANKMVTITTEHAASPLLSGTMQTFEISFDGHTMTETGSGIETPEGTMTPINIFKKAE